MYEKTSPTRINMCTEYNFSMNGESHDDGHP